MKRLGVFVTICGSMLAGCSNPVEPPADSLFGVWEWVRADGGIAGETRTPETEGFTMQLRISRPDRIQLDRDGVAQVVTRFEFIPSSGTDFPFPPRLRYEAPILGQDEQELRFSENGELILSDPCCDGFAYTWLPRLE